MNSPKFTKKVKEAWLEALKSGKYLQGFQKLYTEEEEDENLVA